MSRYPSQTKKGVRQASYAIILFMVANALGIVFILALMPLLAEVLTLPPGGVPSAGFFGGLIAVAAAGCGLLVVEPVGALLVPTIGGIFAGSVGSIVPSVSLVSAAAGASAGIVGAILMGLFLLWTVEGLAAPDKRQLGVIALIVGVAAGVAALVANVFVLYTVPIPTRPQDFSVLLVVPSVVGSGISLISVGLWYVVYRSVLDRFRRGELQAIPPVPMYPMPYAQPYAPYYPPPYVPAPPPQPPAQPPPPNPPPNPQARG